MAASKPSISERLVERYASSRLGDFMSALRSGWNAYSFIFYIGGISAILGGIFGWAGWASAIVTLLFFYYAGKFKEKVDLQFRWEMYNAFNHTQFNSVNATAIFNAQGIQTSSTFGQLNGTDSPRIQQMTLRLSF